MTPMHHQGGHKHGHQVDTGGADPAAEGMAKALAQRELFKNTKDAVQTRWTGGWPILQALTAGALPQVATPIATALGLLINGTVDIFLQAINAQQNPTPLTTGFNTGQAPWNSFLGTNTRPFKVMRPKAGGIYIGNMWDMVSGLTDPMTVFYSAMVECMQVEFKRGQQTEFYSTVLLTPPGVRMDRRLASTKDNITILTEGLGPMTPMGLRQFREGEVWDTETQLQMLLEPTKPLQIYLASLTTQLIPVTGSMIAWVGYGDELRSTGTLT